MADSETASDSKTASLENGFDRPDVPSTKVSTESKDGEGDVSVTTKVGGDELKSVEEVKGGVVDEKMGLDDLKYVVDNKDVEEVKVVEDKKSVEINDNIDEIDLRNTKDGEEKKSVGEAIEYLEEIGGGEEKKDVRLAKEANEKKDVGEIIHFEGQNDAKESKDGEEKDSGEIKEAYGKKDVMETMYLKGQKDAIEAKECERNNDVGKTMDGEEEKGYWETKDEEGKKFFEETKHGDKKNIVDKGMNAKENVVTEVMKVFGAKNNVQGSSNMKNHGEKNDASDVKGTGKKKVGEEGKVRIDDAVLEQLKDSKNKQDVVGINDDEQKGGLCESDPKKFSKPVEGYKRVRAKKQPKGTEKVKCEDVKKKGTVDKKDEEKVVIGGLEEEKEDVSKEGQKSEEKDNGDEEDDDDGHIEKKSGNKKATKSFKRKRGRGKGTVHKHEAMEKSETKGKKGSGKKPKKLRSTTSIDEGATKSIDAALSGSSRERPVREKKTVERLVEVIEKEPNKFVVIVKGRGTPMKDIPNVAYKLGRKKSGDLKFLHQTLFGRRGKVIDFKSNILQFSGFAWHEAEEKQRAKIKEKLDKCVKDNLFDLCDLLDLTLSRTHTKKEEIIVKIVDFLEAPHATTDTILSEREQSEKSRKLKRFTEGGASRSSRGTPSKKSRKKRVMADGTPKSKGKNPQDVEVEDEEEDTMNGVPDEQDEPMHSESDAKENEASEASDDEGANEDDDDLGIGKREMEQSPKKQGSAIIEKRRTGNKSKTVSSQTQVKSPVNTPSSYRQLKAKKDDTGDKVFTRKKKKASEPPEESDSDDVGENEDVEDFGKRNQEIKQSPKQQGSSISKKRKRMGRNSRKASSQTVVKSPVKSPSSYKQAKIEKDDTGEKVFTRKKKDADLPKKSNSKSSVNDNSSGKNSGKGKATTTREERKSGPNKTELRKTICEILKEVDFNTATFTDIVKKLAVHYKMDLTPKKAAIKEMIQEELTKMADEAEDSEEDEGEKEDVGKEEIPKSAAKKVKA